MSVAVFRATSEWSLKSMGDIISFGGNMRVLLNRELIRN
jgi:hypothetical protein